MLLSEVREMKCTNQTLFMMHMKLFFVFGCAVNRSFVLMDNYNYRGVKEYPKQEKRDYIWFYNSHLSVLSVYR